VDVWIYAKQGTTNGVTLRWYLRRAAACVRVLGTWHNNPEQHRRSNG